MQRTIFLVQRAMFLRPLDKGRPQGAKKVSAPDVFGAPATSPSGPKVRSNRPGAPNRIDKARGAQKDPKIRKKAIIKSMQKCIDLHGTNRFA